MIVITHTPKYELGRHTGVELLEAFDHDDQSVAFKPNGDGGYEYATNLAGDIEPVVGDVPDASTAWLSLGVHLGILPGEVLRGAIGVRSGGTTSYHELAMRTAAGPEVFHYASNDDRIVNDTNGAFRMNTNDPAKIEEAKGLIDNDFISDVQNYLIAAARLDDWKSRLFYNKGKYVRSPWERRLLPEFPDYDDLGEGEMSLEFIRNPQLIHAILGIATEGAELIEDLTKLMRGELPVGEPSPILNIMRETGDVDWYQELLAEVIGKTVEETRLLNIDRLRKRYPEKFSKAAAVERADEKGEE